METIPCCCTLTKDCISLISFALGLFATLVAIGYFLKPWLVYAASIRVKVDDDIAPSDAADSDKKWIVTIENHNCLLAIKEIQCEMAVSTTIDFDRSHTLKLVKSNALFLKPSENIGGKPYKRNYIFKSIYSVDDVQQGRSHEDIQSCQNYKIVAELPCKTEITANINTINIHQPKNYKYLRVRLLATNLLGVRKHYERIYKLDCLPTLGCQDLLCNFRHRQLTRQLIKKELATPNI